MATQLKLVRAKRQGTYDGHRRRAHATFVVAADADESWFETVGPAPEGAELPPQLQTAQAPRAKSFTQVMAELGEPQLPTAVPQEQTLAEAAATHPVITPEAEDLVG
jgi:hypothetical protein